MIKKLLSIIFILNLLTNNIAALEADIFVQSTVNRASELLSEDITKEEKIEKLKIIAKDTVDIKGIGFYTLGATRKKLSDNELVKQWKLIKAKEGKKDNSNNPFQAINKSKTPILKALEISNISKEILCQTKNIKEIRVVVLFMMIRMNGVVRHQHTKLLNQKLH